MFSTRVLVFWKLHADLCCRSSSPRRSPPAARLCGSMSPSLALTRPTASSQDCCELVCPVPGPLVGKAADVECAPHRFPRPYGRPEVLSSPLCLHLIHLMWLSKGSTLPWEMAPPPPLLPPAWGTLIPDERVSFRLFFSMKSHLCGGNKREHRDGEMAGFLPFWIAFSYFTLCPQR